VQVNAEPYGSGWMIKVKMSNAGELGDLLDSAAYEKHCDH
jgi:glycine cleavage system H protein